MQANLPRITEAINYNFRLVGKCEDNHFWLGLVCCGLYEKEGYCHLLVLQSLYKYVKAKAKTRNDVQRKPDQTENVIRRFMGGRRKDPLGDQRLWIELTESRIETNRQGSIDV